MAAGVRANVPLAPLTTLRIGGPARYFAGFSGPESLRDALAWARDEALPVHVLGGGSNVIVADAGVDGLVLQPTDTRADWRADGEHVEVTLGAAVDWDGFVAAAVTRGCAGVECLSGIPGMCGAAPIQNIGAYGQELAEVFVAATVFDRRRAQVDRWDLADCGFGYRDSAFKRAPGRSIVLDVTLRLRKDGAPTLRYPDLLRRLRERATLMDVRRTVMQVRATKGMVVDPADPDSRSAGSFFVNPIVSAALADEAADRLSDPGMPRWDVAGGVKLSAAWLIAHSGMHKGYDDSACGGAGRIGLSTKHTLALVNRGGATATELLRFADHVAERVMDASGVSLKREPRVLG